MAVCEKNNCDSVLLINKHSIRGIDINKMKMVLRLLVCCFLPFLYDLLNLNESNCDEFAENEWAVWDATPVTWSLKRSYLTRFDCRLFLIITLNVSPQQCTLIYFRHCQNISNSLHYYFSPHLKKWIGFKNIPPPS